MKVPVTIFVFYNILIIMAAAVAEEEKTVNDICYYLKWPGSCQDGKCSGACMTSGYDDGICRSHLGNDKPDGCYCVGPCQKLNANNF
ncbi:hypothetical protein Hanom_Chr07g00636361 [Helianthus anomalus]